MYPTLLHAHGLTKGDLSTMAITFIAFHNSLCRSCRKQEIFISGVPSWVTSRRYWIQLLRKDDVSQTAALNTIMPVYTLFQFTLKEVSIGGFYKNAM